MLLVETRRPLLLTARYLQSKIYMQNIKANAFKHLPLNVRIHLISCAQLPEPKHLLRDAFFAANSGIM